MLAYIPSLFASSPRSVASITASFTKQVDELKELSEAKCEELDAIDEQIEALEAQADAAANEAYNAQALAARIEAFTTI